MSKENIGGDHSTVLDKVVAKAQAADALAFVGLAMCPRDPS